MDPVAQEIWESSKPHAPAALLAYLARENLPFPSTGVPAEVPGLREFTEASGWTAERYGYEYLHFRCPRCKTNIFQPASVLGIAHMRRLERRWHPAVCPGRAALDQETIWPDAL